MKRSDIFSVSEDAVNEIDNGPRGRVQTDKINYGQTRNMTGGTASKDELSHRRDQQRADAQRQRDAIKARDTRYDEPRQPAKPKVDLDAVWSKVEDVVGQTVPDGDPIDWLIPWFEKRGVKGLDIGEILTKAARKNGYRDMYEYYDEMVQHYNELQGESVAEDDTPGYTRYEEMKDRLANVLIKLYDSGKDLGEISAMADQVAAKLGYDPTDKIFQQAWRSSITDVNLDTNFGDDEPEDDYTDYSMRRGEMGESSDDYQPQSALGKALYRDLGKKKKISPVQVQRNKDRWAKNPHNPANKQTTEASVTDKNFGKVRKNDVVQTNLKVGDLVVGDIGNGRSVFGKVKRIGREHIFMMTNSGKEVAFRPNEIEALTNTYWTDKLDAESASRRKFKESFGAAESSNHVHGDLVNHPLLPKGGKVLYTEGNNVYIQDMQTRKVVRMSITSLLQGNQEESLDEEDQEGQITDFKPGQSATVSTSSNSGVTQTTTVDLKKNPTALAKDPATGKLKLAVQQPGQPQQPGQQPAQQSDTPKTGDKVEVGSDDLKKLAGI